MKIVFPSITLNDNVVCTNVELEPKTLEHFLKLVHPKHTEEIRQSLLQLQAAVAMPGVTKTPPPAIGEYWECEGGIYLGVYRPVTEDVHLVMRRRVLLGEAFKGVVLASEEDGASSEFDGEANCAALYEKYGDRALHISHARDLGSMFQKGWHVGAPGEYWKAKADGVLNRLPYGEYWSYITSMVAPTGGLYVYRNGADTGYIDNTALLDDAEHAALLFRYVQLTE